MSLDYRTVIVNRAERIYRNSLFLESECSEILISGVLTFLGVADRMDAKITTPQHIKKGIIG